MKDTEKPPRWNRASVVAAAADLADREGLGALTLTRLAEVLGIRPPSLFNHVESLGDLIFEVAVTALGQLADRLEATLDQPHTPDQGLLATLTAYRTFVRDHPGRYGATLGVPAAQASLDPRFAGAEARLMALVLQVAQEFGLQGEDALHAVRGWRALVHGFSQLEQSQGFGIPLDRDESFRRAVVALTPGVPPGIGKQGSLPSVRSLPLPT